MKIEFAWNWSWSYFVCDNLPKIDTFCTVCDLKVGTILVTGICFTWNFLLLCMSAWHNTNLNRSDPTYGVQLALLVFCYLMTSIELIVSSLLLGALGINKPEATPLNLFIYQWIKAVALILYLIAMILAFCYTWPAGLTLLIALGNQLLALKII